MKSEEEPSLVDDEQHEPSSTSRHQGGHVVRKQDLDVASKSKRMIPTEDMGMRQLFDEGSRTFTYLLWDKDTEDAILVDPVDTQVARDLLVATTLNLVYVLNTHVHSDHITGTALIKETSPHEHVKSVISKASGAKADIHLEDGDTIHFGSRYITAIATPGHSQGCMCFLLDDEKAVLTGDTLFVHGFGRTDIPGGDATVLYESITNKVFSLPDECTILPGHENSFFRNGKTYSTIGDEKRRNAWMVRPTDSEAAKKRFYAVMESISSQLSTPENLDTVMATNLRDGEKLK